MEIALRSIYGTAMTINGEADPRILANVTWLFDVDLEFEYLVQFYFCDIVSPTPKKLFFNVYINALAVVSDFDLSGKTSNILGVSYFMDVIMKKSKIRVLNVSIGRSAVDSRDLLCRRRRKLSHVGNSVQDHFNGGGDLHIRELDGTPIFPSSTIVFGKKERKK